MWKPIGWIDTWTWSLKLAKHNFSWLLHNSSWVSSIGDLSTGGLHESWYFYKWASLTHIFLTKKKMEHLGKLILKLATFSSNRKHLLTRMLQASCMLEGLISGKWLVGPRGALVHPRPPKFLKKINFFLELS